MPRSKSKPWLWPLLLTLVLTGGVSAVDFPLLIDLDPIIDTIPIPDSTITPDSTGEITDSVVLEPVMYNLGPDSVLISAFLPKDGDRVLPNSPTITLFKSMAFPGWGQYSNRKYFKAGMIFAIESWFIFKAIRDGIDAADWRDKWKSTPDSLSSLKLEYFNKYTKYRDQRNTNIWYTAITIFLSMFDAYVDAHLARFPDKVQKPEDISFDIVPGAESQLRVCYHF